MLLAQAGVLLGEPWTRFSWMQLGGFVLLVVSSVVYGEGEEQLAEQHAREAGQKADGMTLNRVSFYVVQCNCHQCNQNSHGVWWLCSHAGLHCVCSSMILSLCVGECVSVLPVDCM